MFIDLDNRGTGKTTTLIHDAYFTGLPIITTTIKRRDYIFNTAKAMGVNIECYTVNELKENRKDLFGEQVLVDELEDVLSFCLGGVKVVKATMTRRF